MEHSGPNKECRFRQAAFLGPAALFMARKAESGYSTMATLVALPVLSLWLPRTLGLIR
jgi:hypothetical protein